MTSAIHARSQYPVRLNSRPRERFACLAATDSAGRVVSSECLPDWQVPYLERLLKFGALRIQLASIEAQAATALEALAETGLASASAATKGFITYSAHYQLAGAVLQTRVEVGEN